MLSSKEVHTHTSDKVNVALPLLGCGTYVGFNWWFTNELLLGPLLFSEVKAIKIRLVVVEFSGKPSIKQKLPVELNEATALSKSKESADATLFQLLDSHREARNNFLRLLGSESSSTWFAIGDDRRNLSLQSSMMLVVLDYVLLSLSHHLTALLENVDEAQVHE
mgnify:FL=1|jgi:hypothetical protein